ncbi:MAG TPA: hypothetical protein VMV49_05240 [Candidatus Deferrimicrobium sp.]|nr:hypothetical protein [Candidatus Deferrimicrobium sp.]
MRNKTIKVIKLNADGHTECDVQWHTAYEMVAQGLREGLFAFCEPENVIISNSHELHDHNVEKVILFAPIAGG